MALICENGWPVLEDGDHRIYTWTIPTKQGDVRVTLRNGSTGFLLAWWALWWADRIEPIVRKVMSVWGRYVRPIRGQSTGYSNHSGGLAIDLNAVLHPRGVPVASTFTALQVRLIRWKLAHRFTVDGKPLLRWGGDYVDAPVDGMHTEINDGVSMAQCEALAKKLLLNRRGKRLIAANPTQRAVIFS